MTNMLAIQVVNSPAEAPHYRRDTVDVMTATITKCIVVKKGTEEGRPTVDFQFVDNCGNEFVAMLTGRLVQELANTIKMAGGEG